MKNKLWSLSSLEKEIYYSFFFLTVCSLSYLILKFINSEVSVIYFLVISSLIIIFLFYIYKYLYSYKMLFETKDLFFLNNKPFTKQFIYYEASPIVINDYPLYIKFYEKTENNYKLLAFVFKYSNYSKNYKNFFDKNNINEKKDFFDDIKFSQNMREVKHKLSIQDKKAIKIKERLKNIPFKKRYLFYKLTKSFLLRDLINFMVKNIIALITSVVLLLGLLSLIYFDELTHFYSNFITPKNININYTFNFGQYASELNLEFFSKYTKIFLVILLTYLIINIISIYLKHKKSLHKFKLIQLKLKFFLSVFFLILYIISSILVLPSMFLLIDNFINQEYTNISFWTQEAKNGFLAIRISAITLFISMLKNQDKLIETYIMSSKKQLLYLENLLSIKKAHLALNVFFNLSILFLIYVAHINYSSVFIAFVSWAILYILDDWKIVYDYSLRYKVPIPFFQRLKLNIISTLIFVLIALSLFKVFTFINAFLLALILLSPLMLALANQELKLKIN